MTAMITALAGSSLMYGPGLLESGMTIDPASGSVHYVSAGHPAPVLLGPDRVSVPDQENSLPLGIDPDEEYQVRCLEAGQHMQAMLFFTDGLIEAPDPAGELLGLRPVVEGLNALKELSTSAMISATHAAVRQHLAGAPTPDDMTLLAIHFS